MWEPVPLGRSCHVVAGLCLALSSEAGPHEVAFRWLHHMLGVMPSSFIADWRSSTPALCMVPELLHRALPLALRLRAVL